MTFPSPAEELVLHKRVLAEDPLAPADVFQALMGPLSEALRRDLPCTDDEAYDSGIDAVFAYLEAPDGAVRRSMPLRQVGRNRSSRYPAAS
jgi:hypothetical protein